MKEMTPEHAREILSHYVCSGEKDADGCLVALGCRQDEALSAIRLACNAISNRNWHEEFFRLLTFITTATYGKQVYFEQDDGTIYSRISCKYLTLEAMEREFLCYLERNYE